MDHAAIEKAVKTILKAVGEDIADDAGFVWIVEFDSKRSAAAASAILPLLITV